MNVTVVIPTYGRPDLATRAAASAATQVLPAGIRREIIVVDDGGKDLTEAALKSIDGVRYVWKEHAGPAAARNYGARLATGDILAFLDSDTVAQKGWLAAGLVRLDRDKDAFAVEGRVLADRETVQTPFIEAVENLNGGRWLTCNLFVRREDFLALGGFDERFKWPIREDSEFAFRAQEAGRRIVFEPDALVLHPVREVTVARYFYHAQEGKYEALISRQHRQSYRRHFKWIDGRAIPAYYLAHYAAVPAAVFDPRLGLIALLCGCAATLYAWCRKRQLSVGPFLALLPLALVIPYLRLFWVVRGHLRYPKSPD